MKKGKEHIVYKYVYKIDNDGEYSRIDYFGKKMYLSAEFPPFDHIAHTSRSFRIRQYVDTREVVGWTDKYKNVIVRVIDTSLSQTKLKFL